MSPKTRLTCILFGDIISIVHPKHTQEKVGVRTLSLVGIVIVLLGTIASNILMLQGTVGPLTALVVVAIAFVIVSVLASYLLFSKR